MKKITIYALLCLVTMSLFSQDYYWVFFTDKQDTSFDPYEYFDQKAIDRRIKNNIPISHISDFPLNEYYKSETEVLCNEIFGESRWFNAIAVQTSEYNAELIRSLPFVVSVKKINTFMLSASYKCDFTEYEFDDFSGLMPQLKHMQGEKFTENGIDGSGIRIAVFDGGFPGVDNHQAFRHLHKNNKIIKTYNFPKKREDVYGWNSHGTMVLSCIAGVAADGRKIGLATGAEFLLARTEIGAEPAKEEVWWLMAAEWADKNGANIINSSLGYGIDRHYTKDMDGETCLVTRAANMAASKGILVCNAMGNEATKSAWKTLIAPADADSILSVGGTQTEINRKISFSSYGPTADGRLKPNVSAFGHAYVASPKSYTYAHGTSFASPLVAGFAACAWQTRPEYNNIQLKEAIEKSAHMYPYFDYSLGYGVPQASWFTNEKSNQDLPSFTFEKTAEYIIVKPIKKCSDDNILMLYHIANKNDFLEHYEYIAFWFGSDDYIKFKKSALAGEKTLRVFCNSQTESFVLSVEEEAIYTNVVSDYKNFRPLEISGHRVYESVSPPTMKASAYGVNAKFYIQPYVMRGFVMPFGNTNYDIDYLRSKTIMLGLRYKHNLRKNYSLGFNLEWGKTNVRVVDFQYSESDTVSNLISAKDWLSTGNLNFEVYQRIRLLPTGALGFGLFWDTGIYVSGIFKSAFESDLQTSEYENIHSRNIFANNTYHYGVRTRIGYGLLSLFGQYRLSDLIFDDSISFPRFEVGLEFSIPTGM